VIDGLAREPTGGTADIAAAMRAVEAARKARDGGARGESTGDK
jgi:hypothetical protein